MKVNFKNKDQGHFNPLFFCLFFFNFRAKNCGYIFDQSNLFPRGKIVSSIVNSYDITQVRKKNVNQLAYGF